MAMDVDCGDNATFEPTRRHAAFAGLAAAVAAQITLPVAPAFAAGDPTKVVTVPYLKYEVTTESSAESVEVAKVRVCRLSQIPDSRTFPYSSCEGRIAGCRLGSP
jgi:hypothetical protein|tara:strand:+ start:4936 stop:5250 length:315 start_codon:yes stop_codon:yes gene_type:complete